MAPIKTHASASAISKKKSRPAAKPHPADSQDDDDFYGVRELKHQLAGMNLMLKDTTGDGNCLFRACADQLTGSDKDHSSLRQEVCLYIEENADHFRSFLDNETVDNHVAQMRKNGTYGGNVELVAFARLKNVDIKVYQPGFIYVIEGIHIKKKDFTAGPRPILHIAYHSWEHYSSIRNIDGPHDGLPMISPRTVEQKPLKKLTDQDSPRAIEKKIMKITGITDLSKVREVMERHQGDLSAVYGELAAEWEYQHTGETIDINGNSTTEEEQNSPRHEQTSSPSPQLAILSLNVGDERSEGLEPGDQQERQTLAGIQTSTIPASSETENFKITPNRNHVNVKGPESGHKFDKDKQRPSETADIALPKKRLSSREKKELAKKNQKLNRKNKGKDKTSASSTNLVQKSTVSSTIAAGNMRELFV